MGEQSRKNADTRWTRGAFAGPEQADGAPRATFTYLARMRRVDGRPVPDVLVITGPEIDTSVLRALSLRSDVALVGQGPEGAWQGQPALDSALSALFEAWPKPDPSITDDQRAALDALWERYGGAIGLSDPVTLAAWQAERKAVLASLRPAREPLTRPDGTDPEGFSRRVAQAYNEAVDATSTPAKALAAEAGVPVTTVHRWIRDARRLGLIAPARKGKAG
jgi:hypothetical protein